MKRCWHSILEHLNILANFCPSKIEPSSYEWDIKEGHMVPQKCLKFLPLKYIVTCKCIGPCRNKQCKCRKMGVRCVFYCHKGSDTNDSCLNVQVEPIF